MSNSTKYQKQIVRPRFFSSGKKLLSLIALLAPICIAFAQAPDSWTQKANFGGSGRSNAVGFSIGTKGYIGTGLNYNTGARRDFWEYDPSTDYWTQKADFGGSARYYATGMSIGTKGYIGLGLDGGYPTDFWEYDPVTNTWTQKADFAGSPRVDAVGFSIGTKGYIGTGLDYTVSAYRKDFWEYDPSTDTWTQKTDFGGVARSGAMSFSVGTKGYIGTGYSGILGNKYPTDFWQYDPSSNTWTQKANFGNWGRAHGISFSFDSSGFFGLGLGQYEVHNDIWEYFPSTDTWLRRGDTERCFANASFSIGTKGYIGTGHFGGYGWASFFYEYTPCSAISVVSQPSSVTKCIGDEVSFHASFGNDSLTYQWRKNGTEISGATDSSYTISSVVTGDEGNYDVVVSNGCNTTVSNGATLTVLTTGTWLGTTSADWQDANNWCGGIPAATTDVIITSGSAFQPELGSGDGYANNISVGNGASLTVSGGTLHLNGSILYYGTITNSGGTFSFDGTSLQTIPALTLLNAEVNNTSGINITGDLVINESLALIHGTITTDTNKVIIIGTATVSRTDGWVNGNLQKYIPAGSSVAKSFEIGDETNYTPVDLIIHDAADANVIAYTTSGDHALIASSVVDPSKSVNRVWQLSGLVTFSGFDATFHFDEDDVDAGANPNSFSVAKYDGTSWATLTTGTRTALSTGAVNITSEGGFILGCTTPTVISDPLPAATCEGDAVTFSAGFSETDLTYQWKKNTVDIPGATNSSYTISSVATNDEGNYNVAASNACNSVTSNDATLTVYTSGSWLGTTSADWNDAGNWCGGIPTSTTNVVVTGDTPFAPELSSGDGYANNITVGNGASLIVSGGILHLYGNIINDGAITTSGGTFSFEGTSSQTLPSLELQNAEVNNAAGIDITGDLVINGSLSLTHGTITTDTNKVIITSTASITRTSGWVNGNLQKYIPDGTTVAKSYEIGDATRYAPIDLVIHGAMAANVIAYTTAGDHPLIASSAIDPSESVNRSWHLRGLVNFTSFDATFNFNEDDLDAGANPNNFLVAKYDDTSWTTITSGTRTATSTQGVDITSECGFILGEENLAPPSDVWIQRPNFGGMARIDAAGFSIGAKGYIGTGNSTSGYCKDFWEYDPSTDSWTQKADFGGVERFGAVGFSIGTKGYIGTGGSLAVDFWEYDPATNTWTQKADFGGTGRWYAVGFSIGTKGYIGTGWPALKDFWEYDPATDTWTQKADFGGTARRQATGFSIGTKGYIGTGFSYFYGARSDFWEYDPSADTWTQKADLAGAGRVAATGFSISSKGYIGMGYSGTGNFKDFWEYDLASGSWTQIADFSGTARRQATGFSIGTKGYVGTGNDGSYRKDFWEYTPTPCTQHTFYTDADGDGYGDLNSTTQTCIVFGGYVADSNDCNDGDLNIHPGATEVCNYIDDDCSGQTDDAVQPVSAGGPTTICPGYSLSLSANSSSASSYLWSTGATTSGISVSAANTYIATVTFTNGCTSSASVAISVAAMDTAAINTTTGLAFCLFNGPVNLYIDDDFRYNSVLWSTGDTAATTYISAPGTSSVTVADVFGCSATSHAVVTGPPGDPAVFGNGVWNVYAYFNGNSQDDGHSWLPSDYSGYYVDSAFNFSTQNKWNENSNPSTAPGYQGCPVYHNFHSWSAKRQGFPCNIYQIDIPNHDDEAQLFIDGVKVWEHIGCCDAHSNIWTGPLNTYSEVEFRVTQGVGGSNGAIDIIPVEGTSTFITGSGHPVICTGQSYLLTSSVTGSSYLWSNGETTNPASVFESGSYSVTVTDAQGCSLTSLPVSVSVSLFPDAAAVAHINSPGTSVCNWLVTLSSDSAIGNLWNTGETTQAISGSENDYSLKVTNSVGCYDSSSIHFNNVGFTPAIPVAGNSGTVCEGSTVNLIASGLAPGGQAASFNGIDQYIKVTQDIPENDFTIEMWVKTTDAYTGIFSAYNDATLGHDRHLYLENGQLWTRVYNSSSWNSGFTINDGKWHHIALTVQTGVGQVIYVDGISSGIGSTYDHSDFTGQTSFRIGNSEDVSSSDQNFDGQIDNVRIWSEARSHADLLNNMTRETPLSSANLIYQGSMNGNLNAAIGNNGTSANGVSYVAPDYYTYTWTGAGAPVPSASETQTTSALSSGGTYSVSASAGNVCPSSESASTNVTVTPATYYYSDADGDGYGSSSAPVLLSCSNPGDGYVTNNTDCNDGNGSVHPGAAEICNSIDDDCDSQIDEGTVCDLDGDGYTTSQGDCDDNNPGINPGAAEVCNSIDDNCNGQIDEGVKITFYADADNDSYGNLNSTTQACSAPSGYVINGTDCNDANININPGATEICNSIDDNCNGQIDEGVKTTFYADADHDGYGNPNSSAQACTPPSGYSSNNTDCNDANASVNPGINDICNSIDDNCNGQIDENTINTTITPGGTVYFCTGSTVILTANSGSGLTYQWMKNSRNISGATNITYSNNKAGNYQVKETNSFGCNATSAASVLTQVSKPGAAISALGNLNICSTNSVVLQANAGTGFSYQWQKSGINISGATNQNYTATTKGTYKCIVTNSTGCCSTSNGLKVTKSCKEGEDIDDLIASSLKIYPNPTAGTFMIELTLSENSSSSADVQVLNMFGQVIYINQTTIIDGELKQEIQLDQNLPSGNYFVRVITSEEVYTKQIVLQQ